MLQLYTTCALLMKLQKYWASHPMQIGYMWPQTFRLKFKSGVTREHATYNGEGIKQADVNLLAYPLKMITKPEEIKKDLNIMKPACLMKARLL